MKKLLRHLIVISALGAAVTLTMLLIAAHGREDRFAAEGLVRVGLDDAVNRVRLNKRNVNALREMSDSNAIGKVRAFARILKDDPAILQDRERFDRLPASLDVDELHVVDGNGKIVLSYPHGTEGYDMASRPQSSAFLPALKDPEFRFCQDPQPRVDGRLIQYAGVPRVDGPGLVQIGYAAQRVREAERLADVQLVAQNMHVGRDGKVKIVPAEGPTPLSGLTLVREDGRVYGAMSADCDGWRITAMIPKAWPAIADDGPFNVLLAIAFAFVMLTVILGCGASKDALAIRVSTLKAFFAGTMGDKRGTRRGGWREWIRNPFVSVAVLVYGLLVSAYWFSQDWMAMHRSETLLRREAEDIREEIDDSIDDALAFIGGAICARYRTPQRITQKDIAEILAQYDVDEVNVVDADGICIASSIDIVGDNQWKKHHPAEFNRALLIEGRHDFSQGFRESASERNVFRKYVGVAFPEARGYVQLGITASRLLEEFDYRMQAIVRGWTVGEGGFFVCARENRGREGHDDKNGMIVACGNETIAPGSTLNGVGIDVAELPSDPGEVFSVRAFGGEYLGVSDHYLFHRLIVLQPKSEVTGERDRATLTFAAVLLLVLIAVCVFLVSLSELVLSLRGYIKSEHERQEKDLSLAKTIQLSSLPMVFPDEPGFRIRAEMKTAREVGGDFYDFFTLPSGRTALLIADVSGKGVPAALFMMKAKAMLRAAMVSGEDFAAAIATANDRLAENNDALMFVTAWIAIYNPDDGELEYVSAGHNPPLVRRADGTVEWIRGRRSLVLAAQGGVVYHAMKLQLQPGDRLFMYTDGVTEAMNADHAQFGEARLEAAIRSAPGELIPAVRTAVSAFVAGAEQSDDITTLSLYRKTR